MYSKKTEIEYSSSKDWGEDAIVKIKESEINYLKYKNLYSKKDNKDKYLFAANVQIPESINLPNIFILEKWQRPRIWITGRGKKIEIAEDDAYNNFQKIKSCSHDFYNESQNDLVGDGICRKCKVFVQEYFINQDIRKSKYESLELHKDDIFFGKIPLKNHLYSMTQEAAYDINLKPNEKVDLMCAGWLHHSNGQLHSNDCVENILKYFYLEPKKMYESLILQYYDLVDNIKILVQLNNDHENLNKINENAKVLLREMEQKGLPNAYFLQSWILMADQTLLISANNF